MTETEPIGENDGEVSDSNTAQTRLFQVTMLGLKNGAMLFVTMIAMALSGNLTQHFVCLNAV